MFSLVCDVNLEQTYRKMRQPPKRKGSFVPIPKGGFGKGPGQRSRPNKGYDIGRTESILIQRGRQVDVLNRERCRTVEDSIDSKEVSFGGGGTRVKNTRSTREDFKHQKPNQVVMK